MDEVLFSAVNGAGIPALDAFFWLVSLLGQGEFAVPIATLLAWFSLRRVTVTLPVMLVLATLLAGGVTEGLKHAVDRPRPLQALGEDHVRVVGEELRRRSFPSGHSACAGALWVCAAGMCRTRRAWAMGAVLAVLVGFSRVYVGAHFPGDVLVGLVLGALSGLCTWKAHDAALAWWKRRQDERVQA